MGFGTSGDATASPERFVVIGPTASGKSALALGLARSLAAQSRSVEILCVDSMTVYRGMDVGTAKASSADRSAFTHHGLDLVTPDTDFSVGEFKRYADGVLADAVRRNVDVVLVGGTGLYVDAVVNDFAMPGQFPEARVAIEADLAELGIDALYARLVSLDPTAAAKMEPNNERRIVRALEVCVGSGRPFSSFGPGLQASREQEHPPVLLGIAWPREELRRRIEARFADQLAAGFVEEARALLERYGDGLSRTAGQALGYRELWGHLRGETSLDEAIDLAITRTRQFAVRQERWFRRDPRVRWLAPDEVATYRPEGLG